MQIVGGLQDSLERSRQHMLSQALMQPYLNGHLSIPQPLVPHPGIPGPTFPPSQLGQSQGPQVRVSPAPSRSSEDSMETSTGKKPTGAIPKRRSTKDTSNPESTMPNEYKCPLCSERLHSQREFTTHIRAHNEVKPQNDPNDPSGQAKVYYCCLCGKMLSSFSSLDRHMLVHSGERPFSCQLCGQTFTTNGNMHRHSRTHGNRDSRESERSNGSAGSKRGGKKRKASVDPSTTLTNHHPSNPPSPLAASEPLPKPSMVPSHSVLDGPYKCHFCLETFVSEAHLDNHVAEGHHDRLFCHICKASFTHYNIYKLHQTFYHGKMETGCPSITALAKMQEMFSNLHNNAPLVIPAAPEASDCSKISATSSIPSPVRKEEKILDLSTPVTPAKIKDDFMHSRELVSKPGQDEFENAVDEHEEELKDMKLKGEFPCRLCPAVYPNLRALKGHNKEHMIKPPYVCNVGNCNYSSNDKTTLARHMRTHTGEKPFECTICNFGFTTKANCERHVKNKHGKITREEVMDSIIVHEHDENADRASNALNTSLTESNSSSHVDHHDSGLLSPKRARKEEKEEIKPKKPSMFFAPYSSSLYRQADEDKTSDKSSPTGRLADDAPLDLSNQTNTDEPKIPPALKSLYQNIYKSQEPRVTPPVIHHPLAGAMAQTLSHAMPGQLPLPLLFPHLAQQTGGQMEVAAAWLAQQEVVRRQQLAEAAKDPTALLLHLSNLQTMGRNGQLRGASHSPSMNLPGNNQMERPSSDANGEDKSDSDTENYKMVIKNGVLMRKQKQRRYRTERPHECDQCAARFTLRSNMERHVKQQHGIAVSKKDSEKTDAHLRMGEEGIDLSRVEEVMAKVSSRPFSVLFETTSAEMGTGSFEDSTLKCPCCELTFVTLHSLKQHILQSTGASELFRCKGCPYWFSQKAAVDLHNMKFHGDNNNDVLGAFRSLEAQVNTQFKCQICPNASFASLHQLAHHQYSAHSKPVEDDASNEGDVDEAKEELTDVEVGEQNKEILPGSDTPYKCHLCEDGFTERDAAVQHLQSSHADEYKALQSKGAFEVSSPSSSGGQVESSPQTEGENETYDHLRGKFPDYVNRKIICLFCNRKFWSAEDLRRHVRTHTGERPYKCAVCFRRFTLKHSMLRHHKKHDSCVSSIENFNLSEEDCGSCSNSNKTGEEMSSPEEAATSKDKDATPAPNATKEEQPEARQQSELKKKRLMDKINKLSSTAMVACNPNEAK